MVIEDMAVLTASSQLRSSGRQGSAIADELIAFAAASNWKQDMLTYAMKYAKKVQADYLDFAREYNNGYFN